MNELAAAGVRRGWVGGWAGGWVDVPAWWARRRREEVDWLFNHPSFSSREWEGGWERRRKPASLWGEVGGWVGGLMGTGGERGWVGWVEEDEAVGMSCCELGVGWVGGFVRVGGWVGGWVSGWVGGRTDLAARLRRLIEEEREEGEGGTPTPLSLMLRPRKEVGRRRRGMPFAVWVGGWVGWVEENEAV